MWFIKNSNGDIIYLKPNKQMIISRKNGYDIVLTDDASISKLHALITVRPKVNFKDNEPSSTVIVQDTGSKYGTFIINSANETRKLLPSQDQVLSAQDKVKFGLQNHIFTLHYVPFITSTSTLNAKEKLEFQNIIDTLDGVIIEKWQACCTHLTVSNATLTPQIVQALAFGTQIVNLDYWNAVINNVEQNEPLPDATNFVPSIKEESINSEAVSLKTIPERKVLFKGIFFVSFSPSQSSLKGIIECAGGKLVMFKKGQNVKQLFSEQVVVLQYDSDSSQPSQVSINLYDSIEKSLHDKRLRAVPEYEIFLAILYCSTEKYCNPKFHFKKLIGTSNKNRKALSGTILEPDTEDVVAATRKVPAQIIAESLTLSEEMEEKETRNMRKPKLSLGRKVTVATTKDLSQSVATSKKILEKPNFGSEESSREGVLEIDETRSSVESNSNDEETDVPRTSTARRFNLQSKLQSSKISSKENPGNEILAQSSSKNSDRNPFLNPTTSKEDNETFSRKRLRNVSDERSRQKSPDIDLSSHTKVRKTATSSSVTDVPRSPKRSQMDEEEDIFSFVNEGAAKRKRNTRHDSEENLFELIEDPDVKNFQQQENIFEKELSRTKKCQTKRRRSSVSSNDSSIEDTKPEIKVERIDNKSYDYDAPLIRCKKEFDDSMDETCKTTMTSLLRTDIDLTLDNSALNSKTFVKVYTLIPKQRIKLKNMYVWKSQDELPYEPTVEESTSSEDDENDGFRFHPNTGTKISRGRK